MNLLGLPDELLVQIASYLALYELLFLQQTCSRWQEVVRSSAALQYAIELSVAGMIDNPASRLVPGERLRILERKEKAWRVLDMSDRRSLTLSHRPSGIYDLTGGTLLLGERHNGEGYAGTDAVHTINLHAAALEDGVRTNGPSWSNIDLGKQVIDVGLAIQEHDLMAIVTYSYINEAQLLASIDVHLLKHSTGQPHPAAAKPILHFENIHYLPGHCSVMLEISGDSLCFLLNNYFPFINADPVTFIVYNWKTGQPLVGQKRLYSDPTMFNSFVLLSPDTVILPIIPTNALEICQYTEELNAATQPQSASSSPGEPEVPLLKTSCVLELPALHRESLVLRMTCRCEPNPRGPPSSATHADKHTPFYSDPETAVMILHMHLRLRTGVTRVYTMIAHRASLLDIMRTALERRRTAQTSPTVAEESLATQVQEDTDTDVDMDEDDVAAEDDNDHDALPIPVGQAVPAHRPRIGNPFRRGAAPSSSASTEPVKIPWAEWGPAVTRWFQDELAGTRWITTTCGQRFVRVRAGGRIRVYDFNALAVRRYVHGRALSGVPVGSLPGENVWGKTEGSLEHDDEDEGAEEDWEDTEEDVDFEEDGEMQAGDEELGGEAEDMAWGADRRVAVVLGQTTISDIAAWQETLTSGLPYMETSVAIPDEYESALLDEDIIVGLKMDSEGRHIREVVLHRIGGPME
ncbi:hypothetical protein VTO73DRAFT_6955 [Trametes versicolor]